MSPTRFRQPRQILIGTLMAALVVIGVALAVLFATPGSVFGEFWAPPSVTVWAVMVAAAFAPIPIVNAIGFKVAPLAAGLSRLQASNAALAREQSAAVLRFAIIEAPAIAAVAVAFVAGSGGFWIYASVVPVSLWLMWTQVFPHQHVIARTQSALEAEGTRSYLDELYGFAPWTGTEDDVPHWGAPA